jgi:hypothetical protein
MVEARRRAEAIISANRKATNVARGQLATLFNHDSSHSLR